MSTRYTPHELGHNTSDGLWQYDQVTANILIRRLNLTTKIVSLRVDSYH